MRTEVEITERYKIFKRSVEEAKVDLVESAPSMSVGEIAEAVDIMSAVQMGLDVMEWVVGKADGGNFDTYINGYLASKEQ